MLSVAEVAGEAVSTGSGMAEDMSGSGMAVYSEYLVGEGVIIMPERPMH